MYLKCIGVTLYKHVLCEGVTTIGFTSADAA